VAEHARFREVHDADRGPVGLAALGPAPPGRVWTWSCPCWDCRITLYREFTKSDLYREAMAEYEQMLLDLDAER
jgi:hypothetical protein